LKDPSVLQLCIGDALGAATLLLDAAIHSIAKV